MTGNGSGAGRPYVNQMMQKELFDFITASRRTLSPKGEGKELLST
jgi:hypothetical protein